jgi:hypothetical protein
MFRPKNLFNQKLIIALKQIAFQILPAGLAYRLWHLNTRRKPRYLRNDITDCHEIGVQACAQLYVGWADVPGGGGGPAASLYVHDEEVVRIDCFGDDHGHMHFNPEQNKLILKHGSPGIHFQAGNCEEHIKRAVFELTTNTQATLLSNKLSRVRNFVFEDQYLSAAAAEMANTMRELKATRR